MYTSLLEPVITPVNIESSLLTSDAGSTPVIDAILTSSRDGKRRVYAIVNKDPEQSRSVALDFGNMKAKKKLNGVILQGSSVDDYNDIGAENRVVPQETTYAVKNNTVTFPPHSLNFIIVE